MIGDKNIRVSEEAFKDIQRILKWYNLDHKNEKNQKQVIDYVFKEFKKFAHLDYIDREDEVDQSYVNTVSDSRRTTRLDANMKSEDRRMAKQIRDFLQNEPINNNRKVTIDDAIRTTMEKYIELYPQIVSLNDQYVKLQVIKRKDYKKEIYY